MSESLVISLLNIIIKVLPSAITFVEDLVGNDGSISPEHVPQILSHMADLSKASADNAHSSVDTAPSADAAQPVAHESHAP